MTKIRLFVTWSDGHYSSTTNIPDYALKSGHYVDVPCWQWWFYDRVFCLCAAYVYRWHRRLDNESWAREDATKAATV